MEGFEADAFAERNEYALGIDYMQTPPFFELSETHRAATWLADPRAPKIPEAELCADDDAGAGRIDTTAGAERIDTTAGAERAAKNRPPRPVLLEVKDLSHRFTLGRGSVQALDHINLRLEPGRIVGLLGPNGSGKTTLIKMANGLLTWEHGDLLIDGMAPGIETRKIVSYLPERTYLAEWMTAAQTIDFFEDFYPDFRRDRAEDMLLRLNVLVFLQV